MRTLRSVAGNTLLDHKRSEDVRTKCGIQDIVRWSRDRRRECRINVERMGEEGLAKIIKPPDGN
ncbi:hypothetical protein HUJ04_001513 [Dendroctonus ponderosae]|nr:hypothetical protein HUJ04_001513 [Dendroctonus ponderosae]